MLRLAPRLGLMDRPGTEAHKQHLGATPSVGGFGIALGVILPLLLAVVGWAAFPGLIQALLAQVFGEPVTQHLAGFSSVSMQAMVFLAGLLMLHIVGVLDDRVRLNAWVKLEFQLIFAGLMIYFADVRVLEFLDEIGTLGSLISVTLTLLWIVVIVNAFNMLDNMDGLSGGVAAIIAALYLGALLVGQQWFVAAVVAVLLGALLGFLVFNFPPAKIFMGDGGSMVVGGVLAVVSVRTTYVQPGSAMGPTHWYAVLMPLMVMAVPLYDFLSVTVIRTLQGGNPMQADEQHFSHRLVERGMSRRGAVGVIWACTLATALSGAMVGHLAGWQALIAAVQTFAVLGVIALLEYGTRRRDAA